MKTKQIPRRQNSLKIVETWGKSIPLIHNTWPFIPLELQALKKNVENYENYHHI